MSVTPSIVTYKPKSIWQRIQHMEYLFGLFLRKTFASLNAIYITPGAFSAYRKKFFEKHGGFDEGNITEDLEMSLRIQYCGYRIENSITSPAFTLAPKSFADLLKQRKRWYTGLMKNLWKHKKIISKGYGDLGLFVIPIAVISVFFAIFITTYMVIKTLFKIAGEIVFWNTVNFNLPNLLNLNLHILERFFFLFFTNPIILFILLFGILMRIYLVFARKSVGKTPGLAINLPLFFIFFAILFGFWWVVSLIYFLFNKEVKWK
jgi:cellulose synthase/poly-beta-1,6-N-acetylglucosamine synthase-like glycosyltransferase